MEFVAVQSKVEFALTIGVVNNCTGISVYRIKFVRIKVGEQAIVFVFVQILEKLVKFIGAGI